MTPVWPAATTETMVICTRMLRTLVEVANASAVAANTTNRARATSSVATRSTLAATLNRPVRGVPQTSTCGVLALTGAPRHVAPDGSLARSHCDLAMDPLAGGQQVAVVDRVAG